MKRSEVTYLCYYVPTYLETDWHLHLASKNKVEYITSALHRADIACNILSTSIYKPSAFKGSTHFSENGIYGKILASYGGISLLSRIFRKIVGTIILTFNLLQLNKKSIVLAYHSLGYSRLLRLMKKLIGFKLILEVEEIYQDVKPMADSIKKTEYSVIDCADAYIFPTKLLNDKFNTADKPYLLNCGNYIYLADKNKQSNINQCDVVYAGTFDPNKGGVFAAIEATRFLPANYRLHVLGFGSETDINNVRDAIEAVNKQSQAQVIFEGCHTGDDFNRTIQKYEIGLSTQNPGADFNDTSFPSKILTYLTNGLKVVSVDIPAVITSPVGDYITYYHKQTPPNIAQAIVECKTAKTADTQKVLNDLDSSFVIQLKQLILSIQNNE